MFFELERKLPSPLGEGREHGPSVGFIPVLDNVAGSIGEFALGGVIGIAALAVLIGGSIFIIQVTAGK